MAFMSLFAWLGAALAVTAFFMKTMIPLRLVAMMGHICFLIYQIGASDFKQLYYQNPEFGFYIVQLIARRLSADVERLQKGLPSPRTPT